MRTTSSSVPPAAGRRLRRLAVWSGGVLGLVVIVLVAAAVIPGSHSTGPRTARALHSVAAPAHGAPSRVLETHVVGSSISARSYAAVATGIENGVSASGQYVDDLTPLHWRQVLPSIARYKVYAEEWAGRLGRAMVPLTAALRAGHRRDARRDWTIAFGDYLQLGAVYGFLPGRLDDRLAEVPADDADRSFPGLHRIEQGLWTGESPRALVPVADAVSRAAIEVRRTIPTMWVGAFDFTLRGHEIMEDAQRDLMSGADVPWSHEGVAATAASLVAEREMIRTLAPLLAGRNNALGIADYWLSRMATALARVRRPDGTYPTLTELSVGQRDLIDGTLAGTCAALAAVPESLELHPTPVVPAIPTRR